MSRAEAIQRRWHHSLAAQNWPASDSAASISGYSLMYVAATKATVARTPSVTVPRWRGAGWLACRARISLSVRLLRPRVRRGRNSVSMPAAVESREPSARSKTSAAATACVSSELRRELRCDAMRRWRASRLLCAGCVVVRAALSCRERYDERSVTVACASEFAAFLGRLAIGLMFAQRISG